MISRISKLHFGEQSRLELLYAINLLKRNYKLYGSLCESFSHDCLKHLPRVRESEPGRRKRTPGHG